MAKGNVAEGWAGTETARIDAAVKDGKVAKGTATQLRRMLPLVESGALSVDGYRAAVEALSILGVRARPEGGHRATLLAKLPALKARLEAVEAEIGKLDDMARPFGLVVRVVINARPGRAEETSPAPAQGSKAPAGKK